MGMERQRKEKMARQDKTCPGQLYLVRNPGALAREYIRSLGLAWVLKYSLDSNISGVKKKGLTEPT